MARIDSTVKSQLRDLPKNTDDRFPWPLVELFVKEAESYNNGKPSEAPTTGYEWYWVDDMARLSGMGGWLEVDVANRRQGRFKFRCMS